MWSAICRIVYVYLRAGLFVALISEGHVYVIEPGDSVSLECNFHADQYDLFDYPVLWRKSQHLEDSQVNVMGTLMEPFSQHDRFEVTFDAFDSRYRLMLHIHGRLSLLRSIHNALGLCFYAASPMTALRIAQRVSVHCLSIFHLSVDAS